MKSKLYIIFLAICAVGSSCRKEEVTVFPDYDKNWLVVEDQPNDATIHANYLFYKETGIPVYVNDTIGSQQRVDVFGKKYTYYEVLSLSYSLGGIQVGAAPTVESFQYCAKADVPAALAFLKSEIIPMLSKNVHVPSILLVETLNSNAFGSISFKGLNTIVIGKISTIPSMNQTQKAQYKAAILRAILTNAVTGEKYAGILDNFANTSRKYVTGIDAYYLNTYFLDSKVTGLPAGVSKTVQAIGFLGTDLTNPYSTPATPFMDASMYLEAMLGSTDAEFKQLYGSNPVIMVKYGYIRQILTDLGIPIQ